MTHVLFQLKLRVRLAVEPSLTREIPQWLAVLPTVSACIDGHWAGRMDAANEWLSKETMRINKIINNVVPPR